MGYRFRKLYADLVTEDGTVCIVYMSWIEGLGLSRSYSAIELYRVDGKREVIRASIPHKELHPVKIESEARFCLDLPKGQFFLHYNVIEGPWLPPDPAPCDGLHWSVKVARAEAVGHWVGENRGPELRGSGYADWVELTHLTRRLGLCLVVWGRAHLPGVTIVFNVVRFRSGAEWKRAVCTKDGRLMEWDNFNLDQQAGFVRLELPGQGSVPPGHLVIQQGRILHSGPALDAARFPSVLERMITRAITGPIEETRWVSRASYSSGEGAPRVGWALHEVVRFNLSAH